MEKLPQTFRKNGYDYTLVKRDDLVAMYEQHISDTVSRFEVFKIKIAPDTYIHDNFIPSHECIPSNEQFGITAWSCWDREQAEIKFSEISRDVKAKNERSNKINGRMPERT